MTTYPLSLSDFYDKLGIDSIDAALGYQQQYSGQASGSGWSADIGPMVREFTVTCFSRSNDDAADIMASFESLDGMINSFYLCDPRKVSPRLDPRGALLGDAVPQIKSLNINNRAMALYNLPADYVLSKGDVICWDYGSDPVHRAYHRLIETVTSDNTGLTAEFEVRDFIRPGSIADTNVTLLKPAMLAHYVAGSVKDTSDGSINTKISFTARQVI